MEHFWIQKKRMVGAYFFYKMIIMQGFVLMIQSVGLPCAVEGSKSNDDVRCSMHDAIFRLMKCLDH